MTFTLVFLAIIMAIVIGWLLHLRAVEGISAQMAQNIYDFFHEQNA